VRVQIIRQFLKPNGGKLFLFVIFIAIMAGGQIQAWSFSDVPPKPPLYDLLRPFPIWPLWMLLLVPLTLIVLPLRWIGIDVMGGSAWPFIIANIAYFYLLSCLIVTLLKWARSRLTSQKVY
jgi:uncharacterized membrane protein